jgi:hypothetical protein
VASSISATVMDLRVAGSVKVIFVKSRSARASAATGPLPRLTWAVGKMRPVLCQAISVSVRGRATRRSRSTMRRLAKIGTALLYGPNCCRDRSPTVQ